MSASLIRLIVALLVTVLPGISGGQGVEPQALTIAPAPRLVFTEREMELAAAVAGFPELADFYGTNGLKPLFSGQEGTFRRETLIHAINRADDHGLPPARYGGARLASLHLNDNESLATELAFARAFLRWTSDVSSGALNPKQIEPSIKREVQRPDGAVLLREFQRSDDPAAKLAAVEPQDPRYKALQRALKSGSDLIAPADAPSVPTGLWKAGMQAPAIGALRERLAAIGIDGPAMGPPDLFDAPLTEALIEYQRRAGLTADGVAGPQTIAMLNRANGEGNDDIRLSLERMRWLAGHDLMARHVWVNLPDYHARIRENGVETFETRVVIGRADDIGRTPEFSDEIEYLVVNPSWNVPRSMTVRDYLPRLRANRHAVSHLDVVDGRGNVVPRDRIDFTKYDANSFPYRLRQKPDPDNALGLVKFMFPNPWNIYLHDTPTKHLFSRSSRAYSSGCIRIARPFDLAYELLRDSFDDPQARFHAALDSGRETWLHLKEDIPVHLVYFTAFPDDSGAIRRYPDIYGRDPLVLAALERAGLETFPEDR